MTTPAAEAKAHLNALSDRQYDYVWDFDALSQDDIRKRLRQIDRLRYLHGVYERNRKAINEIEHELRSRLQEAPQYPARHPDWLPTDFDDPVADPEVVRASRKASRVFGRDRRQDGRTGLGAIHLSRGKTR